MLGTYSSHSHIIRVKRNSPDNYEAAGELVNMNTIDQFKTCDKQNLINEAGLKVCV